MEEVLDCDIDDVKEKEDDIDQLLMKSAGIPPRTFVRTIRAKIQTKRVTTMLKS